MPDVASLRHRQFLLESGRNVLAQHLRDGAVEAGGGRRARLAGRAQGRASGRGQCLVGLRPTSWQVAAHTRVLWAVSGRPSPNDQTGIDIYI